MAKKNNVGLEGKFTKKVKKERGWVCGAWRKSHAEKKVAVKVNPFPVTLTLRLRTLRNAWGSCNPKRDCGILKKHMQSGYPVQVLIVKDSWTILRSQQIKFSVNSVPMSKDCALSGASSSER